MNETLRVISKYIGFIAYGRDISLIIIISIISAYVVTGLPAYRPQAVVTSLTLCPEKRDPLRFSAYLEQNVTTFNENFTHYS